VDSLSATLAALSDPTRRAILARLKEGPAAVCELAEPFHISQQAISKHLAYLEQARLIRKQRQGRQQICELDPLPMQEAAAWIEDYRREWEAAFGRLRALLHSMDDADAAPKRKR